MSDWIRAEDRLPDQDGKYLCVYHFAGGEMQFPDVRDYYATDDHPHWAHTRGFNIVITHWMPLPEMPKED